MEAERKIAIEFHEAFIANDLKAAFLRASTDFVFTHPNGKTMDQSEFSELYTSVRQEMIGEFETKIVGTTAEGERVCVEWEGSVPLKNGRTYRNRYHFLYIVRNGKIVELREYCNTRAAAKAFAP